MSDWRKSCTIVTFTATETTLGDNTRRTRVTQPQAPRQPVQNAHPTGCATHRHSLLAGRWPRKPNVFHSGCSSLRLLAPETQVECISCQACVQAMLAARLSVADREKLCAKVNSILHATALTASGSSAIHAELSCLAHVRWLTAAFICRSSAESPLSGGECMLRPTTLYTSSSPTSARPVRGCLIDCVAPSNFTEGTATC